MENVQSDQRILVLFFVALLICLVHGKQTKDQGNIQTAVTDRHVWLSSTDKSAIYAIAAQGITLQSLYDRLDILPPDNGADKLFYPESGKSYLITASTPPKLTTNHFRAAPFFNQPLPLNDADIEILTIIPGIGEKLAEKIVLLRREQGPFETVDQVLEVEGIGVKKLEILKRYLKI